MSTENHIARTGKTNTPEGAVFGLLFRDELAGEYVWTFDSKSSRDQFLKDYADGKWKEKKELDL